MEHAMAGRGAMAEVSLSSRLMSAGLARNWWAVGLRGVVGIVFGLVVLALPPRWFSARCCSRSPACCKEAIAIPPHRA
jgi:hypothetical protein